MEGELHLRVNQEKTSVGHVRRMRFLGYTFYSYKGECRLRVQPKSVMRMKSRLHELISRRYSQGYASLKTNLTQYIWGWLGRFMLKKEHDGSFEKFPASIKMCIDLFLSQ
jgi:hypothetical protein